MAKVIRRHPESISALAVSLVVGAISFFAFVAPTVSGDLRFDRALVFYAEVGMALGVFGALLSSVHLLRPVRGRAAAAAGEGAVSSGASAP